mmetsp:Transcript_23804/g.66036  ORF Transcript_23804/g.66036 Transcript_23804/m.66036 type:complete len:261 (-) Transcript_23804:137-919(-)
MARVAMPRLARRRRTASTHEPKAAAVSRSRILCRALSTSHRWCRRAATKASQPCNASEARRPCQRAMAQRARCRLTSASCRAQSSTARCPSQPSKALASSRWAIRAKTRPAAALAALMASTWLSQALHAAHARRLARRFRHCHCRSSSRSLRPAWLSAHARQAAAVCLQPTRRRRSSRPASWPAVARTQLPQATKELLRSDVALRREKAALTAESVATRVATTAFHSRKQRQQPFLATSSTALRSAPSLASWNSRCASHL